MNKNIDCPSESAPSTDNYLSLTKEEKDLELQKSITRLHEMIYKIAYYDRVQSDTDDLRDNGPSSS